MTTKQNCQSQHFNSVNHTQSTRASHPRSTNYSNLFSAINGNTTQLLLKNSANAAQIQPNTISNSNSSQIHSNSELNTITTHIHSISSKNMSSPKSNSQTPPTHSRVTFQSTPNTTQCDHKTRARTHPT